MKAIDTLRQIVRDRSAEVLRFVPPESPIPEGIGQIALEGPGPYTKSEIEAMKEYRNEARLLVDMQTAHAIVLLYDALKPDTQVKADRMMLSLSGFEKMGKIAWKAVK